MYKEKGCGFLEAVYQECLEIEFGLQGIPFVPQAELSLWYKGGSWAELGGDSVQMPRNRAVHHQPWPMSLMRYLSRC